MTMLGLTCTQIIPEALLEVLSSVELGYGGWSGAALGWG
jgi:hypothetical protein